MTLYEDSVSISSTGTVAAESDLKKGVATISSTPGASSSVVLLHGYATITSTPSVSARPGLAKGDASISSTPSLAAISSIKPEQPELQTTPTLEATVQHTSNVVATIVSTPEVFAYRGYDAAGAVSSTPTVAAWPSGDPSVSSAPAVTTSGEVGKLATLSTTPNLTATVQATTNQVAQIASIPEVGAIGYVASTTGYHPNQSAGSGGCSKPPASKSITSRDHITLICAEASIAFRRPDLGNVDSVAPRHITRASRGGDVLHGRKCYWPTEYVLKYTISNLRQNEIEAWITFLKSSLGKAIKLTDHESVIWDGVILNPEAAMQQLRNNAHTIQLELSVQ